MPTSIPQIKAQIRAFIRKMCWEVTFKVMGGTISGSLFAFFEKLIFEALEYSGISQHLTVVDAFLLFFVNIFLMIWIFFSCSKQQQQQQTVNRGVTASTGFIVDRDTPGVIPRRKEINMEQRASDTVIGKKKIIIFLQHLIFFP